MIWDALFIKHSPISESCRGILTTLNALDLNVKKRDLRSLRKWFAAQKPAQHVTPLHEAGECKIHLHDQFAVRRLERPLWKKVFRATNDLSPR